MPPTKPSLGNKRDTIVAIMEAMPTSDLKGRNLYAAHDLGLGFT